MTITQLLIIGLIYSIIGNLYADFVMTKYYKMMKDVKDVDPMDYGGRTWLRKTLRRLLLITFWPLFIISIALSFCQHLFEYVFMALSVDRKKLIKREDNKFGDDVNDNHK